MPRWRWPSPITDMSWRTAASCWKGRPTNCATIPTSRSSISASTRAGRANPIATPSITSGANAGYPRRLMRLAWSLALPFLAAALPATAQTKLAQQCAAFGEAQYRKLSPSVDRVTALDFPPPALERVDAKVGSQAIAAALTLRGRLTYRSGSPFETQFVCLLDAGHRPIFFYALPTLATRSAPTPVTRGAAPAPVPPLQPPTEAPTMELGPQAAVPAPERECSRLRRRAVPLRC